MTAVHPKLIKSAINQTPMAMLGMLVVSIAFIVIFSRYIPLTVLAIWFGCQLLLAALRISNALLFKKCLTAEDEKGLVSNEWFFILLNVYQAATWTASSILLIIYAPQPFELVSFVVTIGIITAATLTMSSLFRVYLVFILGMMIPQIAIMFYYGEHQHIAMVIFSVIYIPATLLLSKSILNSQLSNIKAHEELERTAQAFRKQSFTDNLTNLYNRRYFFENAVNILLMANRENQPVALLMLDIDHFKKINDTYGHQAGDQALISVSQNIQALMRKSDILARVGGEEFAILLPNTSLDGAKLIAEKIRLNIANQPIVMDDIRIDMQLSIGVAELNDDNPTMEKLYMRADKHLYLAKQNGRNQCYPSI
ncbi:GGDEF domain-containing protein [Shewanella aestuarii]|uniref:diguanylate cyclase n=1 Tax=Shewanella aestuarii TaxID=1028752 RepID=A0A6G9QNJ8_9GAMM|nr:GGDEF domain-containing protein [Shewanella aestuarii]QIR15635.1 GGDEF domain-containing protein [Shewanella aestuarii]